MHIDILLQKLRIQFSIRGDVHSWTGDVKTRKKYVHGFVAPEMNTRDIISDTQVSTES